MTADEFVKELGSIWPTREELLRLGLSPSEAERAAVWVQARRIRSVEMSDPLLDLCANFEFVEGEFGIVVHFCKLRPYNEDCMLVGFDEGDPLIISKRGGEVLLVVPLGRKRKYVGCALDGAAFLKALLVAARFIVDCMLGRRTRKNRVDWETVLSECWELAGGRKYRRYWAWGLGIEGSFGVIWDLLWRPISMGRIWSVLNKMLGGGH